MKWDFIYWLVPCALFFNPNIVTDKDVRCNNGVQDKFPLQHDLLHVSTCHGHSYNSWNQGMKSLTIQDADFLLIITTNTFPVRILLCMALYWIEKVICGVLLFLLNAHRPLMGNLMAESQLGSLVALMKVHLGWRDITFCF